MSSVRVSSGSSSASAVSGGVGSGFVLAAIISWSKCQLVGYTILHGIGGWFYVIYALIVGYVKF